MSTPSTAATLIVSGDAADSRFSLVPLANALAALVGRVDHIVLSPSSDGSQGSGRRGGYAAPSSDPQPADPVRRVRCATLPFPDPVNRNPIGWMRSNALDRWAAQPCGDLDTAAFQADHVIVQSGEAAAMIARLHHAAPRAAISYVATEPAGSLHPRLAGLLARDTRYVGRAVALVPEADDDLAPFPLRMSHLALPVDPPIWAASGTTPYAGGRNVVVLAGQEPGGVTAEIVASSFPDTRFVLIGTAGASHAPNLHVLGRLPEVALLPYFAHADAAVAACPDPGDVAHPELGRWLTILSQFGIPTVCPVNLARGLRHGFPYDPARSASVREALASALRAETKRLPRQTADWADLAIQLAGSPAPLELDRAMRDRRRAG